MAWDATKALEYVAGQLGDLGGALASLPLDVITVVGDLATIMFLSALMLLERPSQGMEPPVRRRG